MKNGLKWTELKPRRGLDVGMWETPSRGFNDGEGCLWTPTENSSRHLNAFTVVGLVWKGFEPGQKVWTHTVLESSRTLKFLRLSSGWTNGPGPVLAPRRKSSIIAFETATTWLQETWCKIRYEEFLWSELFRLWSERTFVLAQPSLEQFFGTISVWKFFEP